MKALKTFKTLGDKHRIKLWAYKNAYTLIILVILFIITWCLMIAQTYGLIGR